MQKASPLKFDRFAGFATILQAGYKLSKRRRMSWLAHAVPLFVLVAATIGYFTAASVEGAEQPTHQTILEKLGAAQTTVNGIDTKASVIESSLDQIPPAWSQILPAADRFQLVMGGAAVLDKETGLVWELLPEMVGRHWYDAQIQCNFKNVGGRMGWRLPTIQELTSLVDPTRFGPALPVGHPFSNVQSSRYWSATSMAAGTFYAYGAHFDTGKVFIDQIEFGFYTWCVRGGQGVDRQ
jgi:hypothetical protein